ITIDLEVAAGFARVSVRDSGVGIEPEQLGHIFERYWRSKERRYGGSGLGLFIAKSIVDAHGGQMGVESALGRGTTVWFTVPIAPAAAIEVAATMPSRATDASVPATPVLVVDDDREV